MNSTPSVKRFKDEHGNPIVLRTDKNGKTTLEIHGKVYDVEPEVERKLDLSKYADFLKPAPLPKLPSNRSEKRLAARGKWRG